MNRRLFFRSLAGIPAITTAAVAIQPAQEISGRSLLRYPSVQDVYGDVLQEIINRAALLGAQLSPGERLSAVVNDHALKVLCSIIAEWHAEGIPIHLEDPRTRKALRYALAAEMALERGMFHIGQTLLSIQPRVAPMPRAGWL